MEETCFESVPMRRLPVSPQPRGLNVRPCRGFIDLHIDIYICIAHFFIDVYIYIFPFHVVITLMLILIPILILIYIHMGTYTYQMYTYHIYIYLYQETLGQAAKGHQSLRQGRSCTISAPPISPLQTLPPGVCVCVCVVCVCG